MRCNTFKKSKLNSIALSTMEWVYVGVDTNMRQSLCTVLDSTLSNKAGY